jgi:hypothetical protein
MNLAMEFHDSELTSMAKRGDSIELRFEAYIHGSEGVPGVDAGKGWYQDLMLVVGDGSVKGEITSWPAELYDGTLEIDGTTIKNVIPLPLERNGHIRLTVKPSFYDEPLVVLGNGVSLEFFPGAPRFIEDFPGI